MSKNTNTIQINGQHYDARSGIAITAATKPPAHVVKRSPAKHTPAHRPAPAKTLMRHAVKRPAASSKLKLRAYGPADNQLKQASGSVLVNSSRQKQNSKRLQKAALIAKSQLINHFSSVTASDFAAPLAASQPAPAVSFPAVVPASVASIPSKHKATADLLERALKQATSHQQPAAARPAKSRTHRRVRVIGAGSLAILLLIVVAAQTLPRVRLELASAKAGFSASLPGYQPAGFSQTELNYSPGVVAARFHSNSDERQYTLTQQTSSWDSTALRDTFVAPLDRQYQIVTDGGRTIYLYGSRNATWVQDGIWYIIKANDSLGERQLIQLASSL